MTTAGAFTRFLDAYSDLLGIATGPDGNLWTTEYFGAIRRMTRQGVVTGAFPLPRDVSAHGITAGPDGNLWFADSARDSIGRITPSGVVVLVSTGISAGSDPRGITAGPDGNIWFTEQSADQIGRITPTIDPPNVAIGEASAIATSSATLHGTVDARSLSTSVRFEYGETTSYGFSTAQQTVSAASALAVSAPVTTLEPATTYHYRLVATSGGGATQSADGTFTTSAPAPPPPAPPAPACANDLDDDRDGFADARDPHCHGDRDPGNAVSNQPQGMTESPADNLLLVCSPDQLVLVSVALASGGRQIRLRGFADPGQAGRQVGLYAGGRRVAGAQVRRDGSFQAAIRARNSGTLRYQARLGARRSPSVQRVRRVLALAPTVAGGRVVLRGRVTGRRSRRVTRVDLLGRAGGCSSYKRLATTRVRASGTFTLSAAAFADVDVGTHRARIVGAGSSVSTLPQTIALR